MAALTLADIRQRVYDTMELESSDIPTVLIDLWCTEATLQIVAERKRWPYFEDSWTVAVSASTYQYALSTIGGGDTIRDVSAVYSSGDRHLEWIDHREAQRMFVSASEGVPLYWTVYATNLELYPIPSASDTLTVIGYREVNDWVADGAGASPDLPEKLHNSVLLYCLFKGYSMQEDLSLATYYSQQFAAYTEVVARDLVDSQPSQPLVMNAGPQNSYGVLPGRLRFPWE